MKKNGPRRIKIGGQNRLRVDQCEKNAKNAKKNNSRVHPSFVLNVSRIGFTFII